ncbi:MAG: hypothetical protein JO210_13465 [Acidobacteriaceae bacterium]|nr:hypothetical protein [Acidobacteriaceae bacterium]
MNERSGKEQQTLDGPERGLAKRTGSLARSSYFRYYIHDGTASCRLQLLGELTEAEVPDLNGCWRTAKTTLGSRRLVLDLHALKSVDEAGKQWLAGMAQEGATCSPEGYLRDIVAGKHTAGVEAAAPPARPGVFGRIVNLFRGVGVETAK